MNYITNTTAEKCRLDYSCLNDNNYKPCTITDCVNDRVIFVNMKKCACSYSLNYGNATVCLCPVRKELYQKYKK